MRKRIYFDKRASKEYLKLPKEIRMEFDSLMDDLVVYGELGFPEARKLKSNLFEMRVRSETNWRGLYAYLKNNEVIVLSFFKKKTQKTPMNELKKALVRLASYE